MSQQSDFKEVCLASKTVDVDGARLRLKIISSIESQDIINLTPVSQIGLAELWMLH